MMNFLIIIMKKIQGFNELYYSQQIELFIVAHYTSLNIDLDSYLNDLPESLYDKLMHRIEEIRSKLIENGML